MTREDTKQLLAKARLLGAVIPQDRLDTMTAYVNGKDIQSRPIDAKPSVPWTYAGSPLWDYSEWDYRVKPGRWRASEGESYWFVASDCTTMICKEDGGLIDNNRYTAFNYFSTKEEAAVVAGELKKLLIKHNKA